MKAKILHITDKALTAAHIDGIHRVETLSVAEFLALSEYYALGAFPR